MVRQVAQESSRVNDLAMGKTYEIIAKAMKVQRGYKNPEPEMKKMMQGMQALHMEERKRDVHRIHHDLFTGAGQSVGKIQEIKVAQEVVEKKKDKNMKDEDFMDDEAEILDPNECSSFINNQEIKALEKDYFIAFVNIAYGVVFGGTKSGGVTAFAVSPNK